MDSFKSYVWPLIAVANLLTMAKYKSRTGVTLISDYALANRVHEKGRIGSNYEKDQQKQHYALKSLFKV